MEKNLREQEGCAQTARVSQRQLDQQETWKFWQNSENKAGERGHFGGGGSESTLRFAPWWDQTQLVLPCPWESPWRDLTLP